MRMLVVTASFIAPATERLRLKVRLISEGPMSEELVQRVLMCVPVRILQVDDEYGRHPDFLKGRLILRCFHW